MQIQEKLEVFDALREGRDRRVSRNPAGYLVKSIREDYQPPAGLPGTTSQQDTPAGGGRTSSDPCRRRQANAAERRSIRADLQVDGYLAKLSPAERSQVEAEAISTADKLATEGLRRAVEEGSAKRANVYRQAIVNRHVRALMSSASNPA